MATTLNRRSLSTSTTVLFYNFFTIQKIRKIKGSISLVITAEVGLVIFAIWLIKGGSFICSHHHLVNYQAAELL